MPKRNFTELEAEVTEWIAPITEGKNSNWCKYIYKARFNDRPETINIRNVKFNADGTNIYGKGISLSPEETDTCVDILVKSGFGTTSVLEECVKNRKEFIGEEDE